MIDTRLCVIVKLDVPLSKAVKAVVTNEVDLAALYQDPKTSIKGLGFTIEVKLWTKSIYDFHDIIFKSNEIKLFFNIVL